jgi:hypothetical protein
MKYTCSCCGKEHDAWPALAFHSPDAYHALSANEKQTMAKIDSDFCVVWHTDQTDRFIRCTLTQQVNDHCENLEYGLWVSLSEKSFEDYAENYNNENHETSYFGWLCNDIPGYEFNQSIPTTVFTRTGNQRPEIVPQEDFDHPFVKDYYQGITKQEAEKRIQAMWKKEDQCATPQKEKRPWWKIW